MADKAQPLRLYAVRRHAAEQLRQPLWLVDKIHTPAGAAEKGRGRAYLLHAALRLAARGGARSVGRELPAPDREIRRIGNYKVKAPGFEKLPVPPNIAADDIAARFKGVCAHVLLRKRRGPRDYLKPRHVQLIRTCEQQQRDSPGSAAEVYAAHGSRCIHEIRQKHAVRAEAEMLGLSKKRAVLPEPFKSRHVGSSSFISSTM